MYSLSTTMFATNDFKTQLLTALTQYISGFTNCLKHGLTIEDAHFTPEEMSKGMMLAQDYISFIKQYQSDDVAKLLWLRIKEEKNNDPDVRSLHVVLEGVFTRCLQIHSDDEYRRRVQANYSQRAKVADPTGWEVYREMEHSDRIIKQELIETALAVIPSLRAKL